MSVKKNELQTISQECTSCQKYHKSRLLDSVIHGLWSLGMNKSRNKKLWIRYCIDFFGIQNLCSMHNAICEQGEGRTDPISTHLISSFVLGRMSRFVSNALVTKALQFFLNHHILSARSERKKTIALSRYLPTPDPT